MADESGRPRRASSSPPFVSWWRERAWPLLRRQHWLVIGLLWLTAYALGCIGAAKHFAAAGEARSPLDPFYRGLQLFVMEDGMAPGPLHPWEFEVARFLAPLTTLYTAAATLAALLRTVVQQILLCRRHGHVVLCGLGRKGLELVRDCRASGETVVAIEMDAENDAVTVCRDMGVAVLVGDATERETLRLARVQNARRVVAVTDRDGTNVEIAVRTYGLVKELAAKREDKVHCFVHVVDLKLRALFGRHPLFTDTRDPFEVTVFNVYENAARLLFERHPLDGDGIGPKDPRDVHLVVLGLGQMGESVALQAVRTGHFANRRKLRLTIVDRDAAGRSRSLRGRYPCFTAACAAEFLDHDAGDPDFFGKVAAWAADASTLTTVAITLDDDAEALSCALNMLPRVEESDTRILLRMGGEDGLAVLLRSETDGSDWLSRVHIFGTPRDTCTRRMLLDEDLDRLARGIHEDYLAKRRADSLRDGTTLDAKEPSLQPWARLAPELRDSNRQQADHIPVKLRAVGCCALPAEAPGEAIAAFREEEIEILAIMEHDRWVAERLLAGWTPGPKDTARRRSPYLVEWERIPDPIREYDREAVRRIPALLALSGRKVCRSQDCAV
ncbi:MAG: NAD-binding protein [Lentisphaeria bacterium]|nr:NAD-binding protein [Lentisphaeria bacterium]